mgnify:CR=1 FL=1
MPIRPPGPRGSAPAHAARHPAGTRRGGALSASFIRYCLNVLSRRPPPPAPLLRPRRRTGRLVLAGFGLLLAGAAGGFTLGLSLRPPTPPATTPQPASIPAEAPAQPAGPPAAQAPALDSLLAELEALRQRITAEQARLAAATEARVAAEAQLAQTQRQAAAAAPRPEAPAPPAPPPAPPRPAPRPEPAALPSPPSPSQPRVVLHHQAGSATAAGAAADLAAMMRAGGFEVENVRGDPAVPSQRVVRYFHAEDAPMAARLAGRLGRGWAIQDFRAHEPAPPPGTLEVWLPER